MSKRLTVALAVLVVLIPASGFAQKFEDLLKALGKEVEKAARDRADAYVEQLKDDVDAPCRNLESSALVSAFDESRSETWAVKTVDGRKFQLRQIGVLGQTENGNQPNNYVGTARYLDFSSTGQNDFARKYRVAITYRDLARGESIVGQILATAVNNTLQNNLPSSVSMDVFRVEGKNLDGADWCLSSRSSAIDSVRWIE